MAVYQMESPLYSFSRTVSHVTTDSYLIHTHPFFEIWYCIRGDVDFLLSGVEHHAAPNTLFVIQPNQVHGIKVCSSEAYERWTMHFDPDVLSMERRALLLAAFQQQGYANGSADFSARVPCQLEDAQRYGFRELMEKIDQLATLDETFQKGLAPVFLEAILAQLMICAEKIPQKQTSALPLTRKHAASLVAEYINAHFMEKISLDMLSERFFVTKGHLNLSFRKEMGTTVIDYLIYKRVTYAQQLLMNGLPAAQAAALAGFSDYTGFYRAYVKRFGHPPKQDYGQMTVHNAMQDIVPFELRDGADSKEGWHHGPNSIWGRLPEQGITEKKPNILKDM